MRRKSPVQAFTLLEMLVVLSIIGVLASIAALNVSGLQKPALSDSRALAAALKVARSHALSTTSAVRVVYNDATRTLSMRRADLCSAAPSGGPPRSWRTPSMCCPTTGVIRAPINGTSLHHLPPAPK
ncbi:hypothetical protein GCM10008955_17230 [Deinococcus malanensis]|uniref:Prepilin-type N-terminal cleavage/methylation domain-containing protein n=1 Tax=Deinococcus malanensis TaxID=1706855 RepID=A0ABQ2ESF5_9DEIO|nr:prepilin-type N-terminal cleavage/methylation domain-containing protein [Deinococcus malanensis]GGK24223.1 hypothetical protein GCM10008955_17230 [Deinococcus malanensis]